MKIKTSFWYMNRADMHEKIKFFSIALLMMFLINIFFIFMNSPLNLGTGVVLLVNLLYVFVLNSVRVSYNRHVKELESGNK